MADMREKLNAFLDRSMRWAFEYGQHDCMLEVADWLDYACKTHIAADWRGRYSSEAELDALMPDGLVSAMRAGAARYGLSEAATPQTGDVGILSLPGQERPLGAILMPSGRWRFKTRGGILVTRGATLIVAWGLPCRQS